MIICMILATISFIIFEFLFMTADNNLAGALVTCLKEIEIENVKDYKLKMNLLIEEMKRDNDMKNKKKIRKGKALKKKCDESQKRLERLSKGKSGMLDIIPVAGYRAVQLMGWDSTNSTVKRLFNKCVQFKEKKEAMNYTYYLIASLIGYVLLGVCAGFAGMGIALAMNMGTRSIVVGVVAFVIFGLLGYLPYDNVNAVIAKRAEDIENEFPQAVSKMALLTVAGMEVNQAWRLTCSTGSGTLYDEMRRVVTELDNNVLTAEAYGRFISRCNNNYTTKLATAIIQNVSKGNSEIVSLFRRLNDESWLEHKHNARRKGEQIQSKLLLPTMLMFLGIIILVIIPVMSGFGF